MEPTTQSLDIAAVRQAFPILQEVTYLNVGTYGLMPEPALAAFLAITAEFERAGVAARRDGYEKVAQTRVRLAALLHATPEEIAFTRNATDGINLVLAGLTWQAGDEVITTDQEHEAMIHPLLYLQRTKGIRVRRLEVSADAQTMQARLASVVNERTRLIAMSHVSCETGTRLPAQEICAWAAGRGLLTLFDGAQAVGVFPIDVQQIGCDFYTSNGHKWLGGPKGSGFFYARRERLVELSPAHVGAGTLERVDVVSGIAEPWTTGQRFEFGTRAHAIHAGLGASLDWFEQWGWENVSHHIAALSRYLKDRILERSHLKLLSPLVWEQSSGLTTFAMAGHHAGQVCALLRERWRIYTRHIPHYNAVRISTAHFNHEADTDRLMEALDTLAQEDGTAQTQAG